MLRVYLAFGVIATGAYIFGKGAAKATKEDYIQVGKWAAAGLVAAGIMFAAVQLF